MPDYKNQLITSFIGRVDATFSNAVKNVTTSLNSLTTSTKQLGASSTNINKLGAASKTTATNMGLLSGATKSVSGAFATLARFGAAGAIFGAITGAVRGTLAAIVDFDQALKNLQAITNASNFEVAAFGDKMVEVSNNTKFSAAEVAQAMVYLGQAGFTAKEALESIDAIAAVATGTLTDFATTADLFTSAIRAFQLETKESARVADIFASSVNRSKLTIQGLRTIFNYVGASAHQAGVSLEESAAAAGILANNGLRFSTVGTSMRNVISRMIAPNTKLKLALVEVGLTADDVNPKMVGFTKAMENMALVLKDQRTGLVDAGKAYELFGLRGQQAANVFARAFTSGEYSKMLETITGVGEAFRQQLKQQEGLGVQLKNLTDRWKNLAVALGDAGITSIIRGVIFVFSELAVVLQKIVRGFIFVRDAIAVANGDIELQTKNILRQAAAYGSAAKDIEQYINVLKNIQESGEKTWETEKEVANIIDILSGKYGELSDIVENYDGNLKELIKTLEKRKKLMQEEADKLPGEMLAENRRQLKEAKAYLAELEAGLNEGRTSPSTLAAAPPGIYDIEALEAAKKAVYDLEQQQIALNASLAALGEGIYDAQIELRKAREESERIFNYMDTKWINTLEKLGKGWVALGQSIFASGDQKRIKMFMDAVGEAQVAADDIVNQYLETGAPTNGKSLIQIQQESFASSLNSLREELNKLNKDAKKELEQTYKKQVDALNKELAANKANISAKEALRNRDITAERGTERQRIEAAQDALEERLIAEKEYYLKRENALKIFEQRRMALGGEAVPEQWQALEEEKTKALEQGLEDRYKLEEKYIKDVQENPQTLKEAWDSALYQIKDRATFTWKEIADAAVEMADSFAESTSQAFVDFVSGTKTAAEAFSDMASSILADIAQMIIKQQILNFLIAGANAIGFDSISGLLGGGSSSSGGGSFTSNWGSAFSSNHSGGMAGKASSIKYALDPASFINAPRFHNGGEVPAVLQRGEEVLTRDQAASARQASNVKVVIENNTGTQIGGAKASSKMDLSGEVIRIVLDGIERNRNGLQDSIARVR